MAPELNSEQQRAVDTLSGPLLVLAGAGTGKTRVVTYRVAHLIRRKTAPDRILAVTFTNKAAAEMQQRIAGQLGKRLKKRPHIATFHAYCVRVLRRHIRRLGYPDQFAIYDRGDQESVARGVLREIRVPGELLKPSELLMFIGQWKTRGLRPREAAGLAETDKQHLAAMGYRRYQKALYNAGAVDFDDLLVLTEELFGTHDEVRRNEAERFDHLLVDEYQDTNASQYRIVRALAQDHRNLCVVGDDDQSIYGWRGAEVEHILRFRDDWPDATVVRLERNYRSTEAILTMANRLIAFNKKRHSKVLRAARPGGDVPRVEQYANAEDEARSVVADIRRRLDRGDCEPRDFAILFRTNEQPRSFETELRRARLPYVVVGSSSFFDRKEVRDVLAYLKVLQQPEEEVALLRIINVPPRGIGNKTVETLIRAAVEQGRPLWSVLQQQPLPTGGDMKTNSKLQAFAALIRTYRSRLDNPPLAPIVRELLQTIGYEAEIGRLYPDPQEQQARWNMVEEVINALAEFEQRSAQPRLADFLDEVLLADRDFDHEKDKQLRRNAIVLLTLHSAKGLEFPHVYMVGMEEGLLPHHRSIKLDGDALDEERRLCYVGVTRAQERLTLTLARTRMKWGKPRETIPSRFLYELIGQADNPHAASPRAGPPARPTHRSRRPG